jgi:multidrug efflux pump subunit AcrA (membrane-fusion protein)
MTPALLRFAVEEPDDGLRLLALADVLEGATDAIGVAGRAARAARELVAADSALCAVASAVPGGAPTCCGDDGREFIPEEWVAAVLASGRPARGTAGGVAVPVGLPGGRPFAVLGVARASPAFEGAEERSLERLAAHLVPVFHRLHLELASASEVAGVTDPRFRREAWEHHAAGDRADGDPLQLEPAWLGWSYRLVIAALLAAVCFAFLGRIDELSEGPAVVRYGDRQELSAPVTATVAEIYVTPRQEVVAGQPLLRLASPEAAADLALVDHQFQLQLVERLKRPSDPATADTLISLRAERRGLQSLAGTHLIAAPQAGRVASLRARPGQRVEAGSVLASLTGDEPARATVVAFLPAWSKPYVRTGMELRIRLQGPGEAERRGVVVEVGAEAMGPTAALTLVGTALADAIQVQGAVVPVVAELSDRTAPDLPPLADGMTGRARLAARSRSLAAVLFPGVDDWLGSLR